MYQNFSGAIPYNPAVIKTVWSCPQLK